MITETARPAQAPWSPENRARGSCSGPPAAVRHSEDAGPTRAGERGAGKYRALGLFGRQVDRGFAGHRDNDGGGNCKNRCPAHDIARITFAVGKLPVPGDAPQNTQPAFRRTRYFSKS